MLKINVFEKKNLILKITSIQMLKPHVHMRIEYIFFCLKAGLLFCSVSFDVFSVHTLLTQHFQQVFAY